MASGRFVVIGQALKPFGVKGELKILPFTESSYAFEKSAVLIFGDIPYRVRRIRCQKEAVVVSLDGVDSPEAAAELRGRLVKTEQENLPPKEEDEYYWFELIGMNVYTLDGLDLGVITEIIPTGANDVICVEGQRGEVLLPVIDEVIVNVSVPEGKVVVDPLEGLIPDA